METLIIFKLKPLSIVPACIVFMQVLVTLYGPYTSPQKYISRSYSFPTFIVYFLILFRDDGGDFTVAACFLSALKLI
jgi:hypothetical protein